MEGIFATRYQAHPNPIGLSEVRLRRIEVIRINFLDVDMFDETPLLDINLSALMLTTMKTLGQDGWKRGTVGCGKPHQMAESEKAVFS